MRARTSTRLRTRSVVALVRGAAAFVASTAFALSACDSGGRDTLALWAACDAWARASAAATLICPNDYRLLFATLPTADSVGIENTRNECMAQVLQPGVVADAEWVTRCANAVARGECAACVLPPGSRPAGAPCHSVAQCDGHCSLLFGRGCGICGPDPERGAYCLAEPNGTQCSRGDVCVASAPGNSNGTCQADPQFPPKPVARSSPQSGTAVALKAIGESCAATDSCGAFAWCVNGTCRSMADECDLEMRAP